MLTAQDEKVLKKVKLRLKISSDNSNDELIEDYLDEIKHRIQNYCQRKDIPEDLNSVWTSMVIDVLRVEQSDTFGLNDNNNVQVKVGDTTVSPASSNDVTASNKQSINDIVLNYKADLNRWRKLKW